MTILKRWLYRKSLMAREPLDKMVLSMVWGALEIHGYAAFFHAFKIVGMKGAMQGVKFLTRKEETNG